jgi:hypothetical protein
VVALRGTELELRETSPRLCRVVVRDRGFEPLAEWRRLGELATQPAQQADRIRARCGHSFFT